VSAGVHRLELRDERGAVVASEEVDVGPGEVREISIEMPPPIALGLLRVDSVPPGALVSIDGEEIGTTPLAHEVLATRHRVDVALDGYAPASSEVVLERPGEATTISFALTAAPASPATIRRTTGRRPPPRPTESGTLTIATTPWSEVYLGGRHLGTTPLANVRLPVGTHVLTLRSPGRSAQRTSVTIRADEQTRVRLSL